MNLLFERWRSRWIASLLDVFILQTLVLERQYGKELVDKAKEMIDLSIKVPTVYATLKRFLLSGVIEEVSTESKDGKTRGTMRKYYEITRQGRDLLVEMQDQIANNSQLVHKEVKK